MRSISTPSDRYSTPENFQTFDQHVPVMTFRNVGEPEVDA
jgi:hypothetical protein